MIDKTLIFIPGVRKCGTTTLFKALSRHPKISITKEKEPQFFALKRELITKHLNWYIGLYNDIKSSYIMDGSTVCFPCVYLPEFLKKQFENLKVIIIIRDPAKRAFSSYLQRHKQMPSEDKRSFNQILDEIEVLLNENSLEEAENIMLENAILNNKLKTTYFSVNFHRKRLGANFDSRFEETTFIYKYFLESSYKRYINQYKSVLGSDLKILFFEDMVNNFDQSIRSVLKFLDLNYDDNIFKKAHKNKTKLPSGFFRRLQTLKHKSKKFNTAVVTAKHLCSKRFWNMFIRKFAFKETPKITEQQYQRARSILGEEYDYWLQRYNILNRYWKY
jgi:hypothetical protein